MAILVCLNVVEDEMRDNKRLAAADAVPTYVNTEGIRQVTDFTFLDTDGVTPVNGSIVEFDRSSGGKPSHTRFITVDPAATVQTNVNA